MIKFGKIKIDNSLEPLIIPEIGINHGGNLGIAFKIIKAAKRAGAKLILSYHACDAANWLKEN